MHAYATDGSRSPIYGWLAVVAIAIAWSIGWIASSWPWGWLVGAPSFGAVFAMLCSAFDQWLWRLPLVRSLGVVEVTDVSGTYQGFLISTYKDENGNRVRREVTLSIRQTWTNVEVLMSVKGESSTSKSQSATASAGRRGEGVRLRYIYENRVNPGIADSDMHDHDGAADVDISPDGVLEGRYFNARERSGTIRAKIVQPLRD